MSEKVEDFLAHYGVLGMKWGVRRSREQLDRAANRRAAKSQRKSQRKTERKPSRDFQAVAESRKKKSFELSNEELQRLNNRLEMERKYNDLKVNSGVLSKIKAGTTAVGTIVAVGTLANTAIAVAKGPVGKAIADAITKSKQAAG